MKTKTVILGVFVIICSMIFHNILWNIITLFLPFLETHPWMDTHIWLVGTDVQGLLRGILIGLITMFGVRLTMHGFTAG
jgi:hypothetical protein